MGAGDSAPAPHPGSAPPLDNSLLGFIQGGRLKISVLWGSASAPCDHRVPPTCVSPHEPHIVGAFYFMDEFPHCQIKGAFFVRPPDLAIRSELLEKVVLTHLGGSSVSTHGEPMNTRVNERGPLEHLARARDDCAHVLHTDL